MRKLSWVLAVLAFPASAQQVASPPPTAALPGVVRVDPARGAGEVSKNAPVNGVLVLYGNQRCPTDNNGAEVVVCQRRGAEEQFRVPKELREFQITPENESWALKARAAADTGVGVNGIGSCSTIGPATATGCFMQQARQTRRENADRKEEEAKAP